MWTGLAALALVVPLAIWIVVTSSAGSVREARPLERVVVDGAALQLHWEGTACEQVDDQRTKVSEAQKDVLVTLWVEDTSRDCREGDTEQIHRVVLDDPLGDRDLIDGACLKPENHGHHRCRVEDTEGPTDPCRFCVHPEPAPSERIRVWPR